MALTLDPLRDPVLDRIGHESGHLAAMAWFGYNADLVRLDLKHADFGGNFGHIEGIHRTTGDPKREARDRSTIAAVGPLLGGVDLDHFSARSDIRCVDLNREAGWSADAWRWIATERARDLARHEPFAYTWRLLVVRLHDLGDEFIELRGDEVDRFLAEATDTGSVLVG